MELKRRIPLVRLTSSSPLLLRLACSAHASRRTFDHGRKQHSVVFIALQRANAWRAIGSYATRGALHTGAVVRQPCPRLSSG